jgi:hypothetical protein
MHQAKPGKTDRNAVDKQMPSARHVERDIL